MKRDSKTSSKNLGELMKNGDTKPSHPKPHHHRKREVDSDGELEVEIEEDLEQFDLTSFESILRNAASSKTNLLKNATSKSGSVLFSVMGLVDDSNVCLVTESDYNSPNSSEKAPVKFDEVIDFIDDGVEELVIGKSSIVPATKTTSLIKVTSPICGNPVTDFDKIDEKDEIQNYDNEAMQQEDLISRMEMGQREEPQDRTFDDIDIEKLRKSQKNFICNEQEQIDYLNQRGLHEFNKYNNILGPASGGQFASFSQNLSPVVGTDLGVLNPVTHSNYQRFQTMTPNGHLLPAIPRQGNGESPSKGCMVAPSHARKAPVTIVLHSPTPSSIASTLADSGIPNLYSSTSSSKILPPPSVVEAENVSAESNSQKKRNKKGAQTTTCIETETANEESDKRESESNSDEEKENTSSTSQESVSTDKDEARRLKNRRDKEKKKAKKAEEKLKQENEEKEKQEAEKKRLLELRNSSSRNTNGNTERPSLGVASAQHDGSTKNQQNIANSRRQHGSGGKNRKTEKGVSFEYIVPRPTGDSASLERALYELGIKDLSELEENPGKKTRKANSGKKNKQQQQNQKKEEKEVPAPPPTDKEVKSTNEGAEKSKKQLKSDKKMDEVAVAASVTNRSSSGGGQLSEEDDDQSYVSAQENIGESNSRVSTPPADFADARQSRDGDNENVMLDINNYRDDEDVESLALQLQREEDEFITVGKNRKKNKKQAPISENTPASSAESSSSPTIRRNTHPDARVTSTTGLTNASSSGSPQQQHSQQQQRHNNRPVAHPTTLGDFMEATKTDTHKNIKHKKIGGASPSNSQKKQASTDEPAPSSPTVVGVIDEPISVNTGSSFSYADAAKRSSGENTPSHEMSPVPPATTSANSSVLSQTANSSTPQSSSNERKQPQEETDTKPAKREFSAAVSGVQLPPSTISAAELDVSFGYEETAEDKLKQQKKETKADTQPSQKETKGSTPSTSNPQKPTGMNGVELLKSFTTTGQLQGRDGDLRQMPENSSSEQTVISAEYFTSWAPAWDQYVNTGEKPIMFVPEGKRGSKK